MSDHQGREPTIWRSKLNRAKTVHAFSQIGGWSLCGAVGYSQTCEPSRTARSCKRCVKAWEKA